MAEAVYVNTPGHYVEGRENFGMGVILAGGRATFNSTDSTCTVTLPFKATIAFILAKGSTNTGAITYSISTNVVTFTRTVTTSGGEFSFMIGYT